MRILSISGQNIASLAQPFAIDFTAAPLAGAGLFVCSSILIDYSKKIPV